MSTHTGNLLFIPSLSNAGTHTSIFPTLRSSVLLSHGQFTDDGCVVSLDKKKLSVIKNNITILNGTRNTRDGLWDIPLSQVPLPVEPVST